MKEKPYLNIIICESGHLIAFNVHLHPFFHPLHGHNYVQFTKIITPEHILKVLTSVSKSNALLIMDYKLRLKHVRTEKIISAELCPFSMWYIGLLYN